MRFVLPTLGKFSHYATCILMPRLDMARKMLEKSKDILSEIDHMTWTWNRCKQTLADFAYKNASSSSQNFLQYV